MGAKLFRLSASSRKVFARLKIQEVAVKEKKCCPERVENSIGHWNFQKNLNQKLVLDGMDPLLCIYPGHFYAYLTPRESYSYVNQIVNNRTVQKGKILP